VEFHRPDFIEISSPQTIPTSGSGRCICTGRLQCHEGTDLSDAACASDYRISGGERLRHSCPHRGSMAYGAGGPARYCGSEAGGKRQHSRPDSARSACRWVHRRPDRSFERHQCNALSIATLRAIARSDAGCGSCLLSVCVEGKSSTACENCRRVDRPRQGNSW
jgi:hypothetical protein